MLTQKTKYLANFFLLFFLYEKALRGSRALSKGIKRGGIPVPSPVMKKIYDCFS